MHTYTVPCINSNELTQEDIERLTSPTRRAEDIACMSDAQDPNNGFFVWIDDHDGEKYIPEGFSEAFQKLWTWAQTNHYNWIRLADWGDSITE